MLLVLFVAHFISMWIVSQCVGGSVGTVPASGGRSGPHPAPYIQVKDYQFSGEDRVLEGELQRRVAGGRRAALPPLRLDARAQRRIDKLEATRAFSPRDYRTARALDNSRRHDTGRHDADADAHLHFYQRSNDKPGLRSHKDINRGNRAFIYSANTKMSMALSLQLMEQAIYTVQYRFMDIRKYTSRYANDYAFRIAYILRQIKDWVYEMRVWHKWLSDTPGYVNMTHGTVVSLLYYQYMVRNHVDITQSVYYVIDLHERLVAKISSGDTFDRQSTQNEPMFPGYNITMPQGHS